MSELAKAKAKKIVDAAKIKAKARINAVTVKAAIALEKAKMKVGNAANAKTIINALKAKSKIAIAAIKEKCSIAVNTAIIKAKKYLNSKKKKGGNRSTIDLKPLLAETDDGAKMRALYIKLLIYDCGDIDTFAESRPKIVSQIIQTALEHTNHCVYIAKLVKEFLRIEIVTHWHSESYITKIYDKKDLDENIKKIIEMYIKEYMASPNRSDLLNDALSLQPNGFSHTLPPQQQRSSIFRRILPPS